MIISLNWLKKYINLEGISPEELEDKLTIAGLEVDEVKDYSKLFDKFVVGYVKTKIKHPNADKLSVCTVNDGTEDLQIVCGAPNVDAGQKIVLAKVGAVVPSGNFEIKKAKIRGEKSFGMICSESELGISNNHDGIMVLDPSMKEGTPVAEALGLNDVVYDIAITPNRADALSHIGVARDLGALYGRPVKYPEIELNETDTDVKDHFSVEIEDTEGCERFTAKMVRDVKIAESPDWLKKHLTAIGLRPINNVVDITNFVMYEIGKPIHAYDMDTLAGKKIIVKSAGEKKKFTTLDSKERELQPDDLMICDAEGEVGVAGVMGGENSEVQDTTVNVLIESAQFNASRIRKTAKKLGLQTDASYRFERGCDIEITKWSVERAAQLMAELAEGKVASGLIDVYPKVYEPKVITLRFARINKVLGFDVTPDQVKDILNALMFTIVKETSEAVEVSVPGFRGDVEREIDLIEEIVRIYGYDKVPAAEKIAVTLKRKVDESGFKNEVREILNSLGSYEILTNSLLNEKTAEQFGKSIPVLSPQTVDMSNLRTSLIPGLLATISRNIKVKESNLNLFEIGNVFNKLNEGEIKGFKDFDESLNLVVALTGKKTDGEWYGKDDPYSFYDLKGIIEALINKISLASETTDKYHQEGNSFFEFILEKSVNKTVVGEGGKLKKELLSSYDIDQDVFVFVIKLDKLQTLSRKEKMYEDLLKYPKVFRDCAFVVDKSIESYAIEQVILGVKSKILKNIKLFDIFEGDVLGVNKKSLAYQLEFYDNNGTLTDEVIEKDFWKAINAVKKTFDAQLRG